MTMQLKTTSGVDVTMSARSPSGLEAEFLEKTVGGVVGLFLETMSVQHPRLSERMEVMRIVIRALCEDLRPPKHWEVELAGTLAWIGLLLTPRAIVKKVELGDPLTEEEWTAFRNYHRLGAEMIRRVPMMDTIGNYVALVGAENIDGTIERDGCTELGQQILTIGSDVAWLWDRLPRSSIIRQVGDGLNEPIRLSIIDALEKLNQSERHAIEILRRPCALLLPGDTLLESIRNARGDIVLAKGFTLTPSLTRRLRTFSKTTQLNPIVCVRRPAVVRKSGMGNPSTGH